ncbi:MAG: DUF2202 domain-containing protein [Acidimicrobiia bacterium]
MTVKSISASAVFLIVAASVAVIGVTAAVGAASSDEAAVTILTAGSTESPSVNPADTGLSGAEVDGILFMREEEKLARDVYLGLGDLWDLRIFDNIAASEQRHMDAILGLIETYGLEDAQTAEMIGVFANDDLQILYDGLMTMGAESVEAALEVGATVEEVDIADLEEHLAGTTTGEITTVYENLLRGSRNHLRAFASQLEAAGIDREAAVLDTALYEAIVSSETEQGNAGSAQHDGNVESGSGGHGDGTSGQRGPGRGRGQGQGGGRGQGGGGSWGSTG